MWYVLIVSHYCKTKWRLKQVNWVLSNSSCFTVKMVLVFLVSFVWCLGLFSVRPSEVTEPILTLTWSWALCSTETQAAALGPVSQAVPFNHSTSLQDPLDVFQWWPREARWGHRPGLCGERDAVWAGHGVPGPSLPPRRGLQLQHLPRHYRQPDLFRTRGMLLHSSTLLVGFSEYLALCVLLAGPSRKPAVWL